MATDPAIESTFDVSRLQGVSSDVKPQEVGHV